MPVISATREAEAGILPPRGEDEAGRSSEVGDQPDQYGETLSLLKIQKIIWAWSQAPVIPATQEAEAGESLEPGGGSCSEPRSCHCTPTW